MIVYTRMGRADKRRCAMCNAQCGMRNVGCAMCNAQCARMSWDIALILPMCNVQCAMRHWEWG